MRKLKSYLFGMLAVAFGAACFAPTPAIGKGSIEVVLGTNVAKEAVTGRQKS